jgi:hypothetical protein
MIPAKGFTASFVRTDETGKRRTRWRDVVAWTDDGDPLVQYGPRLENATGLDGYDGIHEHDKVAGVVPGGGWIIEFKDGDQTWQEPVVAWVVLEDGSGYGAVTDDDGELMRVEANVSRLIHPDKST